MWYLYLNNNYVEIYFNDVNTNYVKYPAGDLIIEGFLSTSTLSVKNINNKAIIDKIKATDIAHPLIGTSAIEEYLDNLSKYVNGDPTVIF